MNRDNEPQRVQYLPKATWSSDFKVLKSMLMADIKGDTQQERLESFYVSQADLYDSYRHRMCHGRFPMVRSMPATKNGIWVDLGGGTGSNLEYFGNNLNHFSKVVVLDLCPSLVETAKRRIHNRGWNSFVEVILGDACEEAGLPPSGTVDLVTFSYALSMIPDWRKAIRNAFRMLKPGGYIAVCDFTISESQWFGMASFWKYIFSLDHVHLRYEHIPTLSLAFEQQSLEVGFGTFPYVPSCLKCPYYSFVGRKVTNTCQI